MQVYNTGDATSKFQNILLYGLAGAGKTPMAATMPDVIVISSEPGLKSLQRYRLPYIIARNQSEAMDCHRWITSSNEAKRYQSVFFDSVSASSESILADKKKKSNDPRRFSPETTAATMEIVLAYLSIPASGKHLCMTCKAVQSQTNVGTPWVEPFAVVPKLGPMLPYHFDTVLYMSRHRNNDTGQEYAMFTCGANDLCHARDRSGMLALYEPPDLNYIINKCNGVV